MRFHIHKTEELSIPDYPAVAALLTQVSWHKTPTGFDEGGNPVYDEMTPDDIEKMEFFRAYKIRLLRYTEPVTQLNRMEALIQKHVVSPWFDTRDPDADEQAKREVLGLALIIATSPASSTPDGN